MTNAATLITALKTGGHRITTARKALLELFTENHAPLSVLELGEFLNQRGLDPNKTTIYRELDFLLERGIVKEVDLLDGKKRYELSTEGHHHHLYCNNCKRILCADMDRDLDELEKRISAKYNFQIQSHVLEFFGLCEDCRLD